MLKKCRRKERKKVILFILLLSLAPAALSQSGLKDSYHLLKAERPGQVFCLMPVVTATWEVEIGGS
jgi:hypothetical protein